MKLDLTRYKLWYNKSKHQSMKIQIQIQKTE